MHTNRPILVSKPALMLQVNKIIDILLVMLNTKLWTYYLAKVYNLKPDYAKAENK